jgi:hypothetical protein
MKWHRKRFWRSQREFGIEKNENLWRLLRGPLWHLSCTAASFISICVKEYSAQREWVQVHQHWLNIYTSREETMKEERNTVLLVLLYSG